MSPRQRYLWTSATTAVVLAGVGLPFLFLSGAAGEHASPEGPARVEAEAHYYVLLSVIEVQPARGAEAAKWDIDGSAPDLYYEIFWQGHRVFRSAKKTDTLVAKWSNASVGLGDLVTDVSLDESIKAARITAREGDEVEFRVYDADIASDDEVGRWTVPFERLRVGDQRWLAPAGSVVMAECRVLPLDGLKLDALTR